MPRIPLLLIALFFIIGSASHFLLTDFFVASMPSYLKYHQEIVIVSGMFELLGAVGILIPQSRLLAGYGLIALCVAVFPVNINMALHPEQFSDIPEIYLYIRLPIQFFFVWFIWWAIKPERLVRG
ncbi:MAG: DoxX family protein [Ectothiorhodospiraceae bacterium]|nr:DoxX family protein [Ectothiorhodospiraceae bacterium]